MAQVRPPAVTTDVVVVGSGPAGAAMALALAGLDVDHVVVTRYDSLAAEPRAHITNQRTMEVLDDLGVADAVIAQATPQHLIGTTTFCTAIAGEELGRVRSWGTDSNTSIQDSFNLGWKLALVLRGEAGPALLDTYTAERAPIGRQVVDRANRSIGETGRIFDALGVSGTDDPVAMRANMDARKDAGDEAEKQRRALREAVRFKAYEFDAHGVELNHRYVSTATVPDDLAPDPLGIVEDPELTYVPSTTPGARVPHAWLGVAQGDASTIQLAGHGRFTLFTGPGGEAWGTAPDVASGLVALVVVGPGREVGDPYGDWAALLEAEGIGDTGAVLVRPDHHVAARFAALPADPTTTLTVTLDRALSRM